MLYLGSGGSNFHFIFILFDYFLIIASGTSSITSDFDAGDQTMATAFKAKELYTISLPQPTYFLEFLHFLQKLLF